MKAIVVNAESLSPSVSPRDVTRLVQCLASKTFKGREARQRKRFPVAASVIAIPLDASMRVAGRPAWVVTVNISSGGVALIFPRKVVDQYMAVDFSASGVALLPVILRVNRNRPLARAFEVGGEFICRIHR